MKTLTEAIDVQQLSASNYVMEVMLVRLYMHAADMVFREVP